jgi:hypothetical protein
VPQSAGFGVGEEDFPGFGVVRETGFGGGGLPGAAVVGEFEVVAVDAVGAEIGKQAAAELAGGGAVGEFEVVYPKNRNDFYRR